MPRQATNDKRLFYSLAPAALVSVVVLVTLLAVLVYYSVPAIDRYGFALLKSTRWRPVEGDPDASIYGLLVPLTGTIVTALLAVIMATPLAVSSVFFSEELIPRRLKGAREAFASLVDLMTGIPTIVYGLWGIAVLAPLLKDTVYTALYQALGSIPLFSCKPVTGSTVLTAGILLAIMIMPFIYAIMREAYRQIPATYKEAALALGTTKYEYFKIMLGMLKPAMLAGVLIGFGRAAGETVAVALVIGNTFNMPTCLLSSSYTISSLIANQFANASLYPYMTNVLLLGGLILLVIGLASNLLGLMYLRRIRYAI